MKRYLVEVVERYDLCPWARAARVGGEVAIVVVLGTPDDAMWLEAARHALARPAARVAMIVAPELAISRTELGAVRDRVAAAIGDAGVAEFHPDAPLDLAKPARAVPFARRSPDPTLQLVPLSILASARSSPPPPDRARQLAILHGEVSNLPLPIADRIAIANHEKLFALGREIARVHDDIARDRAASYARVGLVTAGTSR